VCEPYYSQRARSVCVSLSALFIRYWFYDYTKQFLAGNDILLECAINSADFN